MLDRTDRSLVGIWWWTVDRWLLASAILLMVIGTLLVMAAGPAVATNIQLASQHFGVRQSIYLIPALGAMLFFSILEPRPIRILAILGLAVTIGLMIAAILVGSEIKGATRWITIAGINLQPSEFAKPFFAIVSAWLLTLWREGQDFPGWIYSAALMAVLVGILVLQPDIGMTFLVAVTWGFQMFLAGLPMLLVIGIVALAPLGLWAAYRTLDHVEKRIDRFFEGGAWQVEQARDSFANGGLLGVGPGDGTVKLHLPDAHSDFIFAVAAEEYGALACLSLIGLYGFIVLRGFARTMSDEGLFALIAGSSLLAQFGVQAAIHMASSASTTIHCPLPRRALLPQPVMMPPLITVGSMRAESSKVAISEVVVVLPCVPATATDQRSRINSPSISARWTIGRKRSRAATSSGLSCLIAVEITTMDAFATFSAVWPHMTGMPLSRRRRTLAFSDRSLPCTS